MPSRDAHRKPIPIAAVEYLNSAPILYGLRDNRLPHRFDLQTARPSECAARLQRQEVSLALIPSVEYSRIRSSQHLQIVPDIAVTSHGTVASVALFFNRGLSQIRRVAVDASSRTSVALVKIILQEKFDVAPDLVPMDADIERMLAQNDAALIIGDRALALSERMDNKLDLGEEWHDLTNGLPFVYSFWAGRKDALTAADVAGLVRSRDLGLQHLPEIASAFAASQTEPRQTAAFYEAYLTDHIQYHLGPNELEGLREYYAYCYFYGLIDEVPELQFYPQTEPALN